LRRYEQSATSARAHPRFKLFQPTTMVNGSDQLRVHLLDLSANGARVHHAVPPARGAIVKLDCAGRMRSARVAWVAQSRFGVTFTMPLTSGEIDDTLAQQRTIVATQAVRLGAVA
jgi:hypothetical protein